LIQATYIPGNVVLPVANAVTAAAWNDEVQSAVIGDDTVLPVSLAGFTLAKYAQLSIATQVMTIDAFEAYIVNQIGNQLAIAVENAILNGLGPTPTGGNKPQPTGILTGVAWDSTNSITYSATTGLAYDDFVNLRAKLGTVYRPGSQIVMNSGMEAQLFKIKTTTGKPIFSQDPQNGFIQKILNTPYLVDDYIPDETVLLARLDYYYMNFSQAPVIEADKSAGFGSASILYRGLLIADGKPALSEAFVKMTQATA
jgi:HK97 family phage major capsid protein